MIKPEQVPPEAYAAAAELLAEGCRTDQAIAAALNAWPGGIINTGLCRIILPLTQENPDDKA